MVLALAPVTIAPMLFMMFIPKSAIERVMATVATKPAISARPSPPGPPTRSRPARRSERQVPRP
ncbi:MAG: hypothetical protein LC800_05590 [Acidobacteria bacterium]|nr:hypothetical protein [Acidobacteriota bacterium]